jgi:hypothetical protein
LNCPRQRPIRNRRSGAGPIKNASTPISSTPTEDTTANEGKNDAGVSSAVKAEKKPKAPIKMGIASAIYQRMSKQQDVTRKQILEQFVAEAKLSAAGASTYYQLIKAKLIDQVEAGLIKRSSDETLARQGQGRLQNTA